MALFKHSHSACRQLAGFKSNYKITRCLAKQGLTLTNWIRVYLTDLNCSITQDLPNWIQGLISQYTL